jgi:hypothetical protein
MWTHCSRTHIYVNVWVVRRVGMWPMDSYFEHLYGIYPTFDSTFVIFTWAPSSKNLQTTFLTHFAIIFRSLRASMSTQAITFTSISSLPLFEHSCLALGSPAIVTAQTTFQILKYSSFLCTSPCQPSVSKGYSLSIPRRLFNDFDLYSQQ